MRRALLLAATFLLLLTRPGTAQDDGRKEDEQEKARERWEKLDDETREARKKALRDLLKGKTEAEKREILEKLKKLDRKPKSEREKLRERHERMLKDLEGRLLKALSPAAKERFEKLAPEFRRDLLSFTWRRVWEVGQERFQASLTPEDKVALEGLTGREYFEKIGEITDRRVLKGMSLAERESFEARPEPERKKELRRLRMESYRHGMARVEKEAVFPEIEVLLGKPKPAIEDALVAGRRRGPWGRGGQGGPVRAHHQYDKRGREFAADRELHLLLHRLPRNLQAQYDEEFLRIVREHRDPQSRKKALDKFKARLRKLLAD
jgi:hypothetical protein